MSSYPKNLTELLLKSVIVRNKIRDHEFNELQKRYKELEDKCAPNICSGCKQHYGDADSDFQPCNFSDCENRYCYTRCSWKEECMIDGACVNCLQTRCRKCGSKNAISCDNCELKVCSKHAFRGPENYVTCSSKCQDSVYKMKRHAIMLADMY